MQITTDTVAAAWIGWKEYSSKNKNALGEDLMRAALEAAVRSSSQNTGDLLKALRDNAESGCDCFRCRAADCIEDLARVIRRMMTDASFIAVDEGRATIEKWGLK